MRVRLLKMHTHEGQDREPGEVIDLEPSLAEWLIKSGVAGSVNPTEKFEEQEE